MYVVVESTYFHSQNPYISYGIALMDEFHTVLKTFNDLSCDRDAVAKLVETCNRNRLPADQLEYIVEDFLS
jgi:hypothetical protein